MLVHACLLFSLLVAFSSRHSTRVAILQTQAEWNLLNISGSHANRSVSSVFEVRRIVAPPRLSRVPQSDGSEHDSRYNGQQQSTNATSTTSEKSIPFILVMGLAGAGVILVLPRVALYFFGSAFASESTEQHSIQRVSDDAPAILTILRSSGETLAIVDAKGCWYGDTLRKAVSGKLPPHEYLHSIVYWIGACEHQIKEYHRLGDIGIQDGSKLRVITLSSYDLPSSVSLFSLKKGMSGPMGAHKLANLWVHAESSAWLEYGEKFDIGRSSLKYLRGEVCEKYCLRLQEADQEINGVIEQSYVGLHLPVLGNVQLRQVLPDAVFDVSQVSGFVGWISLFENGEMVAMLGKIQTSTTLHLRLELCRYSSADGSQEITFENEQDFGNWHTPLTNYCRSSRHPATLSGPIGRRKLALQEFPILGSVTLTEFVLCSDMSVISPSLTRGS